MSAELSPDLLARLADVRGRCADMRFGQMLATLGLLAEDMFGHSLWDVEDQEFVQVVERFRQDLIRYEQSLASSGATGDHP
jgi:hypothetical protein